MKLRIGFAFWVFFSKNTRETYSRQTALVVLTTQIAKKISKQSIWILFLRKLGQYKGGDEKQDFKIISPTRKASKSCQDFVFSFLNCSVFYSRCPLECSTSQHPDRDSRINRTNVPYLMNSLPFNKTVENAGINKKNKRHWWGVWGGPSLVIQWLKHQASNAESVGLIPGGGIKILHPTCMTEKERERKEEDPKKFLGFLQQAVRLICVLVPNISNSIKGEVISRSIHEVHLPSMYFEKEDN